MVKNNGGVLVRGIVYCFGEVKGRKNGGLAVLAINELKH